MSHSRSPSPSESSHLRGSSSLPTNRNDERNGDDQPPRSSSSTTSSVINHHHHHGSNPYSSSSTRQRSRSRSPPSRSGGSSSSSSSSSSNPYYTASSTSGRGGSTRGRGRGGILSRATYSISRKDAIDNDTKNDETVPTSSSSQPQQQTRPSYQPSSSSHHPDEKFRPSAANADTMEKDEHDNKDNGESSVDDDDDDDIGKLLGFGSFGSTKGKPVIDNQIGPSKGASKINPKRKYRQYMNRRGGYSRPLDAIK